MESKYILCSIYKKEITFRLYSYQKVRNTDNAGNFENRKCDI